MPRPTYTGGRTVYDGHHATTGERHTYTGQATNPPADASAPKHHGGPGFLRRLGSNLADVATHAPGGVIQVGKLLEQGTVAALTGDQKKLDKNSKQIKALGKGTVTSVATDLRHPLRNPGYTLLDVLPFLNAGAKVAEAGRVAKAGGAASDVGKALVTRPVYAARTLKRGGAEIKIGSSQSAMGAAGQRIYDKALQTAAKPSTKRLSVRGAADKKLVSKIGKGVQAEAAVIQDTQKAAGASLVALGQKLKPEEQKALQVVAEEAPLEQRITAASARVTGARNAKARRRHQAELSLLHKAQAHLDVKDGKPAFAGANAAKLDYTLARMGEVAGSREELLKSLGHLTEASIQGRKTDAGRVAIGATYEKPTPGKLGVESDGLSAARARAEKIGKEVDAAELRQPLDNLMPTYLGGKGDSRAVAGLRGAHARAKEDVQRLETAAANRVKPTGIVGGEHFVASPNAIRIPDVATRSGRSLGRRGQLGAAGTVGHQKKLGSTTHEYTGALREAGVRRQDTTALVGESAMEAAKYAGLKHVHELVRKAATSEPQSPSDIAVRLDNLKTSKRMPLDVKQFLSDPEEFFKTATPAEKESAFEGVRSRLFVNEKTLDPEAAAEFQKLKDAGKVGWVPKGLLGDLAKPNIPMSNKAVKGVDAINNASRFAILYLKPAYALPNLLGNAALNVLQQGFAAVPNLARAAKLNSTLGPEMTARIDALMGEGFARAISAHGQGVGNAVVDKAASLWSKGVDTPFRRSAFLYEARRAGYDTPAKLEKLTADKTHLQNLVDISQRANREIIDYANLSPTEREVVRRVIFFYPWVKGSTVYAGRLLREHPVKSAAIGQVGQVGVKNDPVAPSYLAGVTDVGGRLLNPNSAAILQTPAQVGQALAGLAGGNVGEVGNLSNFASPAVATLLAAVAKRDRGGYPYPAGTNLGSIGFDQLVKNLPQYTLGQRISDAVNGKGQDNLYPPNILDAILQYTVGGVAPRKYNKAKLAELAANEKSRYIP